jgi:hypothetical protein
MSFRKILFGYWLCCMLIACATNKPFKLPVSKKPPSNSQQIIELYSKENFGTDTIRVYSSQDLESPSFKYKGYKLDSIQLSLFPPGLIENVDEIRPAFACFRFTIDPDNLGLITRLPGEYSSTVINLFVYHIPTDSIYFHRQLAEDFGDAGDVFLKQSWLYKNPDGTIGLLVRDDRLYYNSMDNPADTSIDRQTSYHKSILLHDLLEAVDDSAYVRKFK